MAGDRVEVKSPARFITLNRWQPFVSLARTFILFTTNR
jgi:hypothetical protein